MLTESMGQEFGKGTVGMASLCFMKDSKAMGWIYSWGQRSTGGVFIHTSDSWYWLSAGTSARAVGQNIHTWLLPLAWVLQIMASSDSYMVA